MLVICEPRNCVSGPVKERVAKGYIWASWTKAKPSANLCHVCATCPFRRSSGTNERGQSRGQKNQISRYTVPELTELTAGQ